MADFRISHGSFVVERRYKHRVARVFSAFSNTAEKREWFAVSRDSYDLDFTVGGKERSRWVWSDSGPIENGTVMGNDTVYLDIVENHRIVLAYSMLIGDYRMSSSMLTFEFIADGDETVVKATEQGAYYERSDGVERRRSGWASILETLGTRLDANP